MIRLSLLFLVLVTGLILPVTATAVQFTEDFEYSRPDSNTFTSGVFQHNIVPRPPMDRVLWNITDNFNNPLPKSGKALMLVATDEITFNLGAGEYVDFVSVDFADWLGQTTFDVIGELGTYSAEASGGVWQSANTSGQNLGRITMVKLSVSEGVFDN